jgi:rRNA-processing protein Efg1
LLTSVVLCIASHLASQVKFFEKRKIMRRLAQLHKKLTVLQAAADDDNSNSSSSSDSSETAQADSAAPDAAAGTPAAAAVTAAAAVSDPATVAATVATLEAERAALELDLKYVIYYPRDKKYISLFQKDPHDEATKTKQVLGRAAAVRKQ